MKSDCSVRSCASASPMAAEEARAGAKRSDARPRRRRPAGRARRAPGAQGGAAGAAGAARGAARSAESESAVRTVPDDEHGGADVDTHKPRARAVQAASGCAPRRVAWRCASLRCQRLCGRLVRGAAALHAALRRRRARSSGPAKKSRRCASSWMTPSAYSSVRPIPGKTRVPRSRHLSAYALRLRHRHRPAQRRCVPCYGYRGSLRLADLRAISILH
jgi:hypothetical protein